MQELTYRLVNLLFLVLVLILPEAILRVCHGSPLSVGVLERTVREKHLCREARTSFRDAEVISRQQARPTRCHVFG